MSGNQIHDNVVVKLVHSLLIVVQRYVVVFKCLPLFTICNFKTVLCEAIILIFYAIKNCLYLQII